MKLKKILDKAAYDALTDDVKKLYDKSGDKFILQVEDDDAAEALRARDHEKRRADKAEKELNELKVQIEELTGQVEELTAKDGDKKNTVEAVEAKWQKKFDKEIGAEKANVERLSGQLKKLLVENKALELANKISTAPAVILPHIRARLQADLDGDEPVTVVLDKDGKASALTIDKLEKEFVDSPDFKSIIKSNLGSGGGANNRTQDRNSGGALPDKSKPFQSLSMEEKLARISARVEGADNG